jgi:hypothetical protein
MNNPTHELMKYFKVDYDLPPNTGIVFTGIVRCTVGENGQLFVMKEDLNNIRIIKFNETGKSNGKRD